MTQTPTPTLEEQLTLLVQEFALDVRAILTSRGNLADLSTTVKTSLVASINELQSEVTALAGSGGAPINDAAVDGDTTATYSADKILDLLSALEARILGPDTAEALNTIKEVADELLGQDAALDNLLTAVGNRVRYDAAQELTDAQRIQARANIAAASQAELDALEASLGDVSADLRAIYRTARDAA